MVALLLGGLLLIDLSVDLLFGFAWRPLPFAMVQNAAILGFSIWLAGQVLGVSSGVLSFDGVQLAAPRPLPAGIEDRMVDDELRQRLVTLIECDRIDIDQDPHFALFVHRMNAPARAVRKLGTHEQ